MSWRKKSGPEHDHINGLTGAHHIRLENTVTGADHHIQIMLGAEHCAHCKRPHPKDDLGVVDPKAIVAEAIEMLNGNHNAVLEYAAKHGIHIKTANGFVRPK